MLTATITNLSSTASIGYGTDTPLPGPFAWITIAASGNKAVTCRVADLVAAAGVMSGFTVGDMLQQLVQMGKITVSYANLAATAQADASGDAVASET